jgi:glycine dehydrogenase subunit 1
MRPYIPNTKEQQAEMLKAIGYESIAQLFESVPENVRLSRRLDIPEPLSELEVTKKLKSLANKNVNTEDYACFLGAGAYDHFIPAVVDSLLSRQEFYTAYTPYQPEISQGTLQAIFEYQSLICELCGMDVANASVYDGASAVAEAAMMACGATRRNKVLAARSLNPEYREVLKTYARFKGIEVNEFGFKNGAADISELEGMMSDDIAAVIVQSPNFFGIVEDIKAAADIAHKHGALLAACCDPVSLALLKSPGEAGADIAVGEGQAMGNPLSFGGPYLGFFAAKENLMRKMPGRIVGETLDRNGKRCYVLTIQTREQHIRREKATSNICSNEALCALAATIYLCVMGKEGLSEAARQCVQKSHYALGALVSTGKFKPVFEAPFFKEFAVMYEGDISSLNKRLLNSGIIGGYDLGRDYPELGGAWLVAVTEKRTKYEIDKLAAKAVEA